MKTTGQRNLKVVKNIPFLRTRYFLRSTVPAALIVTFGLTSAALADKAETGPVSTEAAISTSAETPANTTTTVEEPNNATLTTGRSAKSTPIVVLKSLPYMAQSTATILTVGDDFSWGIAIGPDFFYPLGHHIQDISEAWDVPSLKGAMLAGFRASLFFRPRPTWLLAIAFETAAVSTNPVSRDQFDRSMESTDRWGGIQGGYRWQKGRWSLQPYGELGIASLTHTLRQRDTLEGAPDWQQSLQTYRARYLTATWEQSLTAGYLGLHPGIRAGVKLLGWLTLELDLRWRFLVIPAGSFRTSTWDVLIADAPAIHLSGLAGGVSFVFEDSFSLQ